MGLPALARIVQALFTEPKRSRIIISLTGMDPGPPSKRRRPASACTQCRRRKLRCDLEQPCGPCSKSSSKLRCVYNNGPQRDKSPSPQGLLLDPSWNLQDSCDDIAFDMFLATDDPFQIGESIGFNVNATLNPDASSQPIVSAPNRSGGRQDVMQFPMSSPEFSLTSVSDPSTCSEPWNSASGADNGPAETSAGESSSSDTSERYPPLPMKPAGAVPDVLHAVNSQDLEDERWIETFSQHPRLRFLQPRNGCHDHRSFVATKPEMRGLLPKLDAFESRLMAARNEQRASLANGNPAWRSPPQHARSLGTDLLPARQVCDTLVNAYISTFETVFPILHIARFRQTYIGFWESRTTPDEGFVCKLLVVMALGTSVSPNVQLSSDSALVPATMSQAQALDWIAYSKQWLDHRSSMIKRADLDMAQSVCLLALARHTHLEAAFAANCWSRVDHDLTRFGVRMGLHREPRTHYPSMPADEAELRRVLWATMLELSLQSWLVEGLPPAISSESYDCDVPSSWSNDQPSSTSHGKQTSICTLGLLGRTHKLRLRITQRLSSPSPAQDIEESYHLSYALNSICKANAKEVLESKSRQSTFQGSFLDVLVKPFMLALHRPLAEQTSVSPTSYYSRRMRMELAVTLIGKASPSTPVRADGRRFSNCSNHSAVSMSVPPLTRDAYTALCVQSTGDFAVVQREAMKALGCDLITELEENAFPIIDLAAQHQQFQAVQSCVQLYKERVRAARGQHSAREFLAISCASAYAGALMRGCSDAEVDEAIVAAARTAIETCLDIWDGRPRSSPLKRTRNVGDTHYIS